LARKLFDTGIFSILTSGAAIGVGWKLNFYTAGSATPITTYNAGSAGSANTNPVIADANGRFDEIWNTVGQTIKWTLTDENDVVQVTVDNVTIDPSPPDVDATLEDFLAGDAALPVANGGTGATSAANARLNLAVLGTAGGTVSDDITRTSKGSYHYWNGAAMVEGEWFLTASGASDPRGGLPGQAWLKY
jgi:hypothetical protein